jgi:hypothetical protein
VSVARGGSGFEDSVGLGRGLDSVGGGRAAGGGLMVYLVVMRVYGDISWVWGRGEGGRGTVVGLACRRRVDCVSHCWAVSR